VAESKNSLDKWWSLQMANMARPSVFETLDPVETAKALDEALLLRFQTEVEVTETARSGAADDAPAAPETEGAQRPAVPPVWPVRRRGQRKKQTRSPSPRAKKKTSPRMSRPLKPQPKPEPEVKTAPPAEPSQKQETKPADQRQVLRPLVRW